MKSEISDIPFSIIRPVEPPKVLRRLLRAPKDVVASRRDPVMY